MLTRALIVVGLLAVGADAALAATPSAELRSRSGTVDALPRSACWPDGNAPLMCFDGHFVSNPLSYHPIALGETVSFGFDGITDAPVRVRVQVWRLLPDGADVRKMPHGESVRNQMINPSITPRWRADVAPGRYVLSLGAHWGGTSAAWTFGVAIGDTRSVGERGSRASPIVRALLIAALGLAVLLAALIMARRRSRRLPQ